MKESSIVKSILDYLKTVPECMAEKTHGSNFGKAGKPDISGCLRGRRFELEVKVPGNKPTPIQEAMLRKWNRAGAITGVVTSLEEAKIVLGIYTHTPRSKNHEPKV
jgi:hypothetical protein